MFQGPPLRACWRRYGCGYRLFRAVFWGGIFSRLIAPRFIRHGVAVPLIARKAVFTITTLTARFPLRGILRPFINLARMSRRRNFWNGFAASPPMGVSMFTVFPIGHRACPAKRSWRSSRAGISARLMASVMLILRLIRASLFSIVNYATRKQVFREHIRVGDWRLNSRAS